MPKTFDYFKAIFAMIIVPAWGIGGNVHLLPLPGAWASCLQAHPEAAETPALRTRNIATVRPARMIKAAISVRAWLSPNGGQGHLGPGCRPEIPSKMGPNSEAKAPNE